MGAPQILQPALDHDAETGGPGPAELANGILAGLLAKVDTGFNQASCALGEAVNTIETIVATLTEAARVFDDGVGSAAVADLTSAASGLLAVSGDVDARSAELRGIQATTGSLRSSTEDVLRCLQVLDVYGMNIKITAAGLSHFRDFADEMRGKLEAGNRDVRELEGILAAMERSLVDLAHHDAVLLGECRRVVPDVPDALIRNAAALQAYQARQAEIAGVIASKADDIRSELYTVIQAIQVGDRVRQRLEHVHAGVQIQARLARDVSLPPHRLASLQANLAPLLAALATAAEQEYTREIACLTASLDRLGAQSRELIGLDSPAGDDAASFLALLEAGVESAQGMLQQLALATTEGLATLQLIIDTADAVTRRAEAIAMLRIDVQHMAINIGLSCRTAGPIGRPVLVIANEVRRFSERLDTIAGDIIDSRSQLASACARMGAQAAASTGGSAGELSELVSIIRACGKRSAEAMAEVDTRAASMSSDLAAVQTALTDLSEARFEMEQLATILGPDGAVEPADDEVLSLLQPLLDELARQYTMAGERDLHDAHLPPGAVGIGNGTAPFDNLPDDDDEDDGLF